MPLAEPPPPPLEPPVGGAIVRGFDFAGSPFAAGAHRGIDLAAPAGAIVRAPCRGRVAFAGRTPGGRGVTLVCGGFRVTVVGVAPAVRRGRWIGGGAPLGRAQPAAGHLGVHLGIRRAGEPFGYVDPAPLLRGSPPPVGPPGAPIARDGPPPRAAPVARRGPPPRAAPARWRPPADSPGRSVAPLPVWAGLAAVLVGACSGWRRRRGQRRARRVASAPVVDR